jgi:hypothetical protein
MFRGLCSQEGTIYRAPTDADGVFEGAGEDWDRGTGEVRARKHG